MPDDELTVSEFCRRYKVRTRDVGAMISAGELRAHRGARGRSMISAEEAARWYQRRMALWAATAAPDDDGRGEAS
jgi:hypothetical protein